MPNCVRAKSNASVTGWQPDQAAAHLLAAFESAQRDGYGECLWLEPTGQYWWMLRREDERLEVAVMYSAGVVPGWQHVFRAVDEMGYLDDLVREELRTTCVDRRTMMVTCSCQRQCWSRT